MPVDRLEVRVSITKLLITLVIVIVPMSIIGFILTQRSDKALDSAIGNDYRTMAQLYSNEVSQFMADSISGVKAMAADPAVITAVANADRSPGTKNSASSAEQAAATAGAAASAPMSGMLGSTASQLLRQRRDLNPRFLGIVATDQNGTVVAASQKPATSSYAHDELWQAAYNGGGAAGKVSNIIYDEFTKSYYVNVSMTITGPSSNAPIGILNAEVNLTPILTRFQAPIGNGARAVLVNDDGMIISAPGADVFARVKSADFDAVRDSVGSTEGHRDGWQMASLQNGPVIVGFAATGLKQHYDNLGWVVMVSQQEHVAAAAIRGLERFALLMVILALFMLTLLCVYYFLHRSQRLEDIEEVLPHDERAAAASA